MAITVERMVAVLEARLDQFEKGVAKARTQAVGDFTAITTAGDKMEASIARIGTGGKKGIDSLNKSMTSLKGQTGNLAAQFNDIGVQLAGGQSPFLIAIQQGSQINQVLGQAGARGAVSALGGAFMSMLNPVSLATIAAITLGGTVIQYFSSLMSEGEKSEATLEKQAQLIGAVTKEWGDALPLLKAYVDERERLAQLGQVRSAAEVAAVAETKEIEDVLAVINREYTAALRDLRSFGSEADGIVRDLTSSFSTLQSKIMEGTATSDDLKAAQLAMSNAVEQYAKPSVLTLSGAFEALLPRINAATAAASGFRAEAVAFDVNSMFEKNIKDSTLPALDPLGFINPDRDQTNRANATKSQTQIAAEAAAKAASAASAATSDAYDSATQSLEERTAALQAQHAAQSQLNPLVNDYGFALEKAKAKQDLLTAAEKAGKEVTPQLAAEIDNIAGAYAKTSAELQKLAEANREAAEAIQFQKDLLNGALSDIRTALEDGKLSWEDLGNVAVNVLNKIADRLQTMLVDQLFSSGGFNIFSLLGGLTGTVGGVSGTGGAGAVGKVAAANTIAKAPRVPSPAAMAKAAQQQNVHVTLGLVKNGLNIEQEVVDVSAKVSAVTIKEYSRNGLHQDIQKHAKQPRVRGR